METSFVTVWVLVAFLVYEYFVLFSGANIATLAAAGACWHRSAARLSG